MHYLKIPKTNLMPSRLCFGGWQASGWGNSSETEFCQLLDLAIEQGINFIDTAEVYGKGISETLIAKVIKSKKRESLIIASKFWAGNARPEKLRKSLEESLARLGTDYLDIYYYHWPSKNIPLAESIAEMQRLKEQGKIRAIGVCNWMEPEWQEFKDHHLIDILQPCYNLLWRGVEKNVLSICSKNNIAVFAYSPLAQGLLAGRYLLSEEIPEVKSDPRRVNVLLKPENLTDVKKIVAGVKKVAQEIDVSPAQVALNWLLLQENISGAIVGITKESQLMENLKSLDFQLSHSQVAELTQLSADFALKNEPYDTLWGWHPKK